MKHTFFALMAFMLFTILCSCEAWQDDGSFAFPMELPLQVFCDEGIQRSDCEETADFWETELSRPLDCEGSGASFVRHAVPFVVVSRLSDANMFVSFGDFSDPMEELDEPITMGLTTVYDIDGQIVFCNVSIEGAWGYRQGEAAHEWGHCLGFLDDQMSEDHGSVMSSPVPYRYAVTEHDACLYHEQADLLRL